MKKTDMINIIKNRATAAWAWQELMEGTYGNDSETYRRELHAWRVLDELCKELGIEY